MATPKVSPLFSQTQPKPELNAKDIAREALAVARECRQAIASELAHLPIGGER